MAAALDRLNRLLGEEEEENKTKKTGLSRLDSLLSSDRPANERSKQATNELLTTGQTTYRGKTYTTEKQTGRSTEDAANTEPNKRPTVIKANDERAAEERFGGMSTDDLFSYVPTDRRDKTLYETYMDSRTRAAEALDRQSRQAMSDAASAGNDAEGYRQFVGMPGASNEEIFGLAQAIRENNAQAKSLEPQKWLEYAEGLRESEERKQSLTEQGRELGRRAAAANEQGQAWEYSNIIKGYGNLINSPDYAARSQYVAPKESAVNIWEKDKNDSRLIYMAANGDRDAQTLLQHNAQNDSNSYNALTGSFSFGAGSIYDLGGDNDYLFELTDTEKGVYNALYASSPEAADNFLDKLKPYLEIRARDTYTKRMAELANEAPGAMSVVSVGANIPQSLEYAVQLGELLSDGKINQNNPAYRASQMSNAVRGEVSKMAEERWGKAGSAAYNLGMSFADFLTTTALSGGSKALSLGLMGTRVAANTVLNLKDRGYDDTAAFTLGTIAGAAEIVTESFSLETILNPDLLADGIARYLAKSFLAEASEEGASNLINLAAENIYDAITGNNEAEWKQQVYDAIQNGADPNDAVLAAIQSNLVQLGTDVLSGGISGFLMAGAATPIHVNNFNTSQQGQYANAIRGNEEGLQALIQSGMESPQGTESYQRAQAAQAQVDKGKTPSTLSIARLVDANQRQIDNETAEQSGQGRLRLTLPRTVQTQNAPQATPAETAEQIEAFPANTIPDTSGAETNTAQEPAPVPQEPREAPRLTLPTRAAQAPQEQNTAAPRLTLPTARDAMTRAAQAENDLVTRLRASKPGLLMDDYATNNIDETQRKAIDETAKRLGLRVAFSDTVSLGTDNAKIYGDGVVLIEKNNPNPVAFLYGHEMGHWLQQNSPDAYKQFAEAARATDPEWFKAREEATTAAYRNAGIEISPERIQEEVLSDYAGWLVNNEDVLNRFIEQNRDKPNVLRRLYEAIKALAAKLTGKEKQQADTAADLLLRAMNATEANVQNGIMSTSETRSSIGGEKAVYADYLALQTAKEETEKKNTAANRNAVRKKTGWFKGKDGKWRFEIDDSGSRVVVDRSLKQLFTGDQGYETLASLMYSESNDYMLLVEEEEQLKSLLDRYAKGNRYPLPSQAAQKFATGHGTIGDILKHEELYRQYPFIEDLHLYFKDLGPTTMGETNGEKITLNTRLLDDEKELRLTLLHEIQHLIQKEEGFARGSNTRYWQREIDRGYESPRPSDVAALKAYTRFRAKHPDLVRAEAVGRKMFDDIHKKYQYVDTDVWENKETGELHTREEVWGKYDKQIEDTERKYGKLLEEYYDVLAKFGGPEDAKLAWMNGQIPPRTAFELYQDTYGEAEARNVELRAIMTPEQRKRMAPFSGNEDSVFVERDLRDGSRSSMKGLDADTAPGSIAADGFPSDAKQFDDDYMDALSTGDRETMSSMIRAAAIRAGYDSPLLMHGTAQFGFTKFDKTKVDDNRSFFLTADKRTAGSYYHGPDEIREIRTAEARVDYSTLPPDKLLEEAWAVDYPTFSSYGLLDDAGKAEVLDAARTTITQMRSGVKARQYMATVDPDTGEITNEDEFALFDALLGSMEALSVAEDHDEINAAWNKIDEAIHDLEVLGLDTYLAPDPDLMYEDVSSAPAADQFVFDYDELRHAKTLLDDLTRSEALYRDYDVTLSLSPYASTFITTVPASAIIAKLNTYQASHRQTGIYQFYCNPGKQLVIECNNGPWNDIDVSQDIRKELRLYGRINTRKVSEAAYNHGYDSVYFRDIRDNGGHTSWFGPSDVYIYFDGSRVKSADPVTVDDNGEVIKPSERFKPINDFRRSLKGLNADIAPESIQKYGQIPKGEKPARDINVPRKVTDKADERVSWTARTVLEAKATPDAAIPGIAELVEKGAFSYKVQTDKAAIENAEATIKDKGWSASLADWIKDVSKGNVNKANAAMGWALYNNAANAGDLDTALTVLDLIVKHQRNAAQALQASRILKQLTPEARLYGVQRSVDNLVKELQERYGKKKNIDIKINRDLAQAFLDAKTEEERQKALEALYKDIGRQVPATFIDKWNAWRYLAMLGNLRTHLRNVAGNFGFAPVVFAKDQVATVLEGITSAVSKGKVERTKGLVLPVRDSDLVKAAWDRYQSVREEALGGSKYNESQMANKWIEDGRKIFNKPLDWLRRKNGEWLDKEDVLFSRPHYTYALAQYCKANGITPAQIRSGEGMDQADEYAIKEAQKATYRDVNAFSSFVSSLGRSADRKTGVGKAASAVLEGVLPFRKTPANILVRGLEYSPIGLLKSLTYDIAQVMKTDADGNPRMSVAEMLDDVSEGLTGTGLLALGALLVKLGLLRGHGEEEKKERDFYDLMGYQNYALTLPNGKSYTLDWLAPEALPLFVGANIYEKLQQSNGDMKMSDIIDAIGQISEPMLEMSMLQSLNDVLESVGYAKEEGLSALTQTLSSAVTSYLTQAIPTLLGQGERTGEKLRMTTYTDKNNEWLTKNMQYTLGKISAKIPGWDYAQIPYIDAWGRTEETGDGWVERAFKNMVNPAYTDQTRMSDMEVELLRLYNIDPDKYGSVLPSRPDKYFKYDNDERIDLTGEQYVTLATRQGQLAYDLLTELTDTEVYKNASDEDKAEMISSVYTDAKTIAKGELLESLGKTLQQYETLKGKLDKGADILDMIALTQELDIADEANNANESHDTLEKLAAIEALNLPEAKAEPLMEQKLSESQWEKYNTLKDAGVNYDTRLDIMRKYSELNANDEMKPGDKALEFSRYVDGLRLTGSQNQLVKDTYKFWSMVPAEATRYETFKASGLNEDKAKHTAEILSALEPLPGKEAVTDLQRYRAIAADKVLTDKEKLNAIGSIMGTELKTEKGNPTQWAKFNLALNNGQSLSQAIDLCENGRLDEFEKWTESAAKGQKVTWDVYDTFLKETADLTGDKDANGKTISGSLKKKVVAYIDSLNLTPDQKDALLTDYNSTYKHDVTWHSGSYGSGKAYAKANLSRLELPRTTTTRSGRLTLSRR